MACGEAVHHFRRAGGAAGPPKGVRHAMIKRVAALVVLLIAMFVLSACSFEPARSPAAGPSTTALLKTSPDRPAPMQEALLELTLRDAQGRPVTGAAVSLDLTMPGMAMPPNRPAISEVGNGVYTARAFFTMAGEWQVRAVVKHPAGDDEFTFLLRTK